jgi:sugar phosphate isomerase/epimerase
VTARMAAISDDLSSDFARAARVAADAGLDGLGVRHVNGTSIAALPLDAVRDVRRTADAHGLAISAVSSPFGRGLHLGSDDGPALALLDRMVAYADVLGTPLVRVFAPWIAGKDPLPQWWDRPCAADAGEVAERMAHYAARAERAGVTLMVELEGASHVGQVAEAAAVLTSVDSPALALCWDVCNGWWSGELPWEEGWPLAAGLAIVDVQTKDVRADLRDPRRPTYTQVVLGTGDIPYDRILAALLDTGYTGWFTAERVYHPRKPETEPGLLADVLADLTALRGYLGR